ncbi:MAG: hypothetical protein ACFFDB_10800 [Promethearchaeota archaeon]
MKKKKGAASYLNVLNLFIGLTLFHLSLEFFLALFIALVYNSGKVR